MYELNFSFKAIFKSFQENKPEMVYLQMIVYQIALIPRKHPCRITRLPAISYFSLFRKINTPKLYYFGLFNRLDPQPYLISAFPIKLIFKPTLFWSILWNKFKLQTFAKKTSSSFNYYNRMN